MPASAKIATSRPRATAAAAPEAGYNPTKAIFLKVCSVTVLVGMSTCIKAAGEGLPPGEIVFYRSTFAILPILVWLATHHQLRTAFRTQNPVWHLLRGIVGIVSMGFSFYGLTLLPLPEAIAIAYASPLIAVIFAAVFLRERVRIFRWSAVLIGLGGVLIICWPNLTLFGEEGIAATEAIGAVSLIIAAILSATVVLILRRLIRTEKTPTIVLYFSLSGAVLGLMSMPFGWETLDWQRTALLVTAGLFGGIGQILLTHCYRFADVSTIAPFEYTSILPGIVIGYLLFGDVPTAMMLAGTCIVIAAGIFVIFREQHIGIRRRGARRALTPHG